MNALDLIKNGTLALKENKISSHRIDSEILLSSVLGKSREEILINLDEKINSKDIFSFKKLIERRSSKEPLAYILKEKEFWSKKFEVNESTLVPRPETELMLEKLIKIYKDKKINILDIGTGSGCILISLLSELKNSIGVGIDISTEALKIAKKKAKKHKINNKIFFYNKSFTEIYDRKFDLIVSNPPYLLTKDIRNLQEDIKRFEPLIALDGGNDGLDVIKKVIYKAKNILKFDGMLALEIGNGQFRKVSNILFKNNFRIKYKLKDYKDNTRIIISILNR